MSFSTLPDHIRLSREIQDAWHQRHEDRISAAKARLDLLEVNVASLQSKVATSSQTTSAAPLTATTPSPPSSPQPSKELIPIGVLRPLLLALTGAMMGGWITLDQLTFIIKHIFKLPG